MSLRYSQLYVAPIISDVEVADLLMYWFIIDPTFVVIVSEAISFGRRTYVEEIATSLPAVAPRNDRKRGFSERIQVGFFMNQCTKP